MNDSRFPNNRSAVASEPTLIRAAQQHDHGAENDLIRRYEPLIRRIVRRLRLPQGCDPEDIAQEARIGLVHAIRRWRPERGATFSAYAARCATNQAIKGVNAAAALRQRPLNTAASLDVVISRDTSPPGASDDGPSWTYLEMVRSPRSAGGDPELALLTMELLDAVIATLPTLTQKERAALTGALNGRSHSEMAALSGGTVRGSKQSLRRARGRLASYGLGEPDAA